MKENTREVLKPWQKQTLVWLDWLIYSVPPGPKCVPMHIPINIQKAGMPLYLAFLMFYFDNFSH